MGLVEKRKKMLGSFLEYIKMFLTLEDICNQNEDEPPPPPQKKNPKSRMSRPLQGVSSGRICEKNYPATLGFVASERYPPVFSTSAL